MNVVMEGYLQTCMDYKGKNTFNQTTLEDINKDYRYNVRIGNEVIYLSVRICSELNLELSFSIKNILHYNNRLYFQHTIYYYGENIVYVFYDNSRQHYINGAWQVI